MASNPPVPTSASWEFTLNRFRLGFDTDLEPGPITGTTLTFRANNNRRRVVNPTAAGPIITGSSVLVGADVGDDVVDYAPPPFDIRHAVTLVPAAAFADFPLGVIP